MFILRAQNIIREAEQKLAEKVVEAWQKGVGLGEMTWFLRWRKMSIPYDILVRMEALPRITRSGHADSSVPEVDKTIRAAGLTFRRWCNIYGLSQEEASAEIQAGEGAAVKRFCTDFPKEGERLFGVLVHWRKRNGEFLHNRRPVTIVWDKDLPGFRAHFDWDLAVHGFGISRADALDCLMVQALIYRRIELLEILIAALPALE